VRKQICLKQIWALARAMKRMATGNRITQAGDDAAGLAISENLRAQLRGMKQARRNANDGISMVQVAEGGLNQVSNMLIRLRELAVQSASDTIGDDEREMVDVEYQQIKQELQRITESTEFNGTTLLNGDGGILDIQIGIHNDPRLDRLSFDASKSDASIEALGIIAETVLTKQGAQANFGAVQNRLTHVVDNLSVAHENLSAANSRIRDTDYAEESAELAKQNILKQASVATLAQANNLNQLALKLIG